MNNISKPQFQVTYGAPAPVVTSLRHDPNAPLYASEDGAVASLSNNECVFQIKRTGEAHVMTYQVLQAMDQCREFRTWEEHTARILTTMPNLSNQRQDMQRVFDNLVQRRLLVSDQDFIGNLAEQPARQQAPMRAVFIRACDRPAQLERLLATLTEYERHYRSNHHYVILDDSINAKNVDRQRDLLREYARNTGCKVSYVGSAERARLVEHLARAVPNSRESLEWLLTRGARTRRPGGGRGWNLALLLSAGTRLSLLDEDFRLPLRQLAAESGINPDPNAPVSAHFYRNMEEALAAGEEVVADPFALHLDACGQGIGALTAMQPYRLDRQSLRGMNLGRLAHLNTQASVLGTLNGTYGSSGTETGLWLYQLDPTSRAEFWLDRESYLRNVEAQHIWYGVNRARVSSFSYFTPFTLDNGHCLPCTNPEGRGEDGLFGVAAHFCHPESLMLQLPVAIGHVQEDARNRSALTLAAHTPRFNHFLRDYIQRQLNVFKAEDPGQRLHLLGEILRDLAGASSRDRVGQLQEYLGFVRADIIERLQQQFESSAQAPIYWQADAREIIQSNGKAVLGKAAPRLGDWAQDLDERGCAENLSAELRDMANAYAIWPKLWQHAQEQGDKLLSAI